MSKSGRHFLIGLGLALCGTPALAKDESCLAHFAFENNTRLTLANLSVMLKPHEFNKKTYYLRVAEFDTDFEPERKGKGGVAIVYGGDPEGGGDIAGGMVLSDDAAYFDEEASRKLNQKNGALNAVFKLPQSYEKCAGFSYILKLDRTGAFYVNGKRVG